MTQDPLRPVATPRNWALIKARLFGAFLALLGAFLIYSMIEYWLFIRSNPVAEFTIAFESLELLVGLALLLFGLGMLARRRWAWLGAAMTIGFALSWWMALGLGSILFGPDEEWMAPILVGIVLPAALGFLGLRFLFARPIRACYGATDMRVRGWMAGAVVAGVLVPVLLNAANLADLSQ